MRSIKLLMTALAFLAFSGCGKSDLDGSLSEAFDLSFSSIQIARSPSAVQVSYLKSSGNEVVIRLTLATEGLNIKGGDTIDLSGEYSPGHPRAAVSRAIDKEPVRVLPKIARGVIKFSDPPEPGKDIDGSFSLSFDKGGDIGSGRTLEGNFSGTVVGVP